jgi:hypothetical protein
VAIAGAAVELLRRVAFRDHVFGADEAGAMAVATGQQGRHVSQNIRTAALSGPARRDVSAEVEKNLPVALAGSRRGWYFEELQATSPPHQTHRERT